MPSVLIVDDDTDLLEMVDQVLSNAGMNANCIYDAATLFDSVTHIRPDIVVMDVFLGEQDGRSLCYSLKTSENFKDIPIILYSAGIISGESVRNALADAFLIKPFNIHALIAKIKELTIKN